MDERLKYYFDINQGYKLEEEIGSGGYGRVYKIYKETLGKKYYSALKVVSMPTNEMLHELRGEYNSEEEIKRIAYETADNFISEIEILFTLRGNSYIVNYEGHDVQDNGLGKNIFIRMEYLKSLRDRLKASTLSLDETLYLGECICRALETCHLKGIIHRDIKESNIFISEDNTFKLGDFGISKKAGSFTLNTRIGTSLYKAPEIDKGVSYDYRVDIYSLGMVLYKLLNNGKFPFEGTGVVREEIVGKIIRGDIIPNIPGVPDKINKAILKAISNKPEDRWQSAAEFRQALMNCREYIKRDKEDAKTDHIPIYSNRGRGNFSDAQAEAGNSKEAREKEELTKTSKVFKNIDKIKELEEEKGQRQEESKNIRRQRAIMIGLILLAVLAVYGVGSYIKILQSRHKVSQIVSLIPLENSGNISGNYSTYSTASFDGEYLYFPTAKGILKMKKNQTEPALLNEDKDGNEMSLLHDTIYYTHNGKDLYSLKKGTGETQRLYEGKVYNLRIFDSKIYFMEEPKAGYVYEFDAANKKPVNVFNEKVDSFFINDGIIYYLQDYKLFEYDISKKEKKDLGKQGITSFSLYENALLFKRDEELYISDIDCTYERLIAKGVKSYTGYGSWIYYLTSSEVRSISLKNMQDSTVKGVSKPLIINAAPGSGVVFNEDGKYEFFVAN
ncbi:protein kinase domain-containing protein [Fonticella tunisiensis]|uniref:non-specific serine/threonine protein kinase n=1 Tax=Fonticella tunisiensis TaxID=1096341 RepID=A0A4R7KEJ1_9CLOT|nr:protein kinase [Fonticella tunisiensis]TDT51991.1 serine/threonine protein kinase [Fonticella tunisiensis]